MLLMMWVESSRCFPVRMPSAWMIRSVVSWKASRPPSCCIRRTRKLWRVFWGRWVSSMSSRRAWCQSRLNSSCSRASSSVRLNISLRRWTPRTVCTARLGRPLSTQYMGAKRLLVNQGERLVSENLGPTSLQALSLLRRHQELGLPEALLRVSYSEHPPLPRPGAAPTTFYYIIPTLPQAGEGFLRTNQLYVGWRFWGHPQQHANPMGMLQFATAIRDTAAGRPTTNFARHSRVSVTGGARGWKGNR